MLAISPDLRDPPGTTRDPPRPYVLAGSTLVGAVAVVTLLAVALAALGALALADEVEHHLHLLGEAQGFDLDGLGAAVRRTLLGLHGDLEGDLWGGWGAGSEGTVVQEP